MGTHTGQLRHARLRPPKPGPIGTLGGTASCTLTGDVASVEAAVQAGRAVLAEAGVLVNAVVLSRPHPDVYREVV